MTLDIYADLEQGTDEWLQARCGLLTASTIGTLITPKPAPAVWFECPECGADSGEPCVSRVRKTPTPIKTVHPARTEAAAAQPPVLTVAETDTARNLTYSIAAERITQWVEPTHRTEAMWRGVMEEPLARDFYHEHVAPVTEVGFMVRDFGHYRIGYSPDGLVGDDGLIEIKSRAQKKQVSTVVTDEVPPENMAQLQAALLVTGREWVDYISYSGGMAFWRKRVKPDERWFAALNAAAAAFETDAAWIVATYTAATDGLPLTERTNYFEDIVI